MTPYHNHRGDERMRREFAADAAALVEKFVIWPLLGIALVIVILLCAGCDSQRLGTDKEQTEILTC